MDYTKYLVLTRHVKLNRQKLRLLICYRSCETSVKFQKPDTLLDYIKETNTSSGGKNVFVFCACTREMYCTNHISDHPKKIMTFLNLTTSYFYKIWYVGNS